MSGDRYTAMFARLAARGEGAFAPFAVLGDPDLERSRAVLEALVAGGADALELGIPFSDPIADGAAIQAAARGALAAGVRPADALALVREVRDRHADLPIGLLVYANLVERMGRERFYAAVAEAGVDSVLVADVPEQEAAPFRDAARRAGVVAVGLAPPNAGEAVLAAIASRPGGYVYVVSRPGVTGADSELREAARGVVARLRELGAPPALLGFGVAEPEHVRAALAMGAAGVISGSAVAARIARHAVDAGALRREIEGFVRDMRAATRAAEATRPSPAPAPGPPGHRSA
jgi:tryptophan synthase alpha chain